MNSIICTLMHNPSKSEFCAHVWLLDGCFIFWNVEGVLALCFVILLWFLHGLVVLFKNNDVTANLM